MSPAHPLEQAHMPPLANNTHESPITILEVNVRMWKQQTGPLLTGGGCVPVLLERREID